ncbi:unnamed protein product, partial [marine sediment metagenome]
KNRTKITQIAFVNIEKRSMVFTDLLHIVFFF